MIKVVARSAVKSLSKSTITANGCLAALIAIDGVGEEASVFLSNLQKKTLPLSESEPFRNRCSLIALCSPPSVRDVDGLRISIGGHLSPSSASIGPGVPL
jgi:hypothetical protein